MIFLDSKYDLGGEKPSKEQEDIYDNPIIPGRTLCIIARAGSGKTHTLLNLLKIHGEGKKILMTSFNRNAVADLRTGLMKRNMSKNIDCRTLHSLCFNRFTGGRWSDSLKSRIGDVPPTAYLPLISYYYETISRQARTDIGAWFAVRTKEWFSSRYYDIASFVESLYLSTEETELGLTKEIYFDALTSIHNNIIFGTNFKNDRHGTIRLNLPHNAYAKAMQLERIELDYDIIIVDECQDTIGPCIEIVNSQDRCAKVLVGDPAQQIYEWNGAQDALESMAIGSKVEYYTLSYSFRCPAKVVEYANLALKAMNEKILMHPKLVESIPASPKRRILAHSNWGALMCALELRQQGVPYNLDCEYVKLASSDPEEQRQMKYKLKIIRDLQDFYHGRTGNLETREVRSLVREFGNFKGANEFAMKADKGWKQLFMLISKSKGNLECVIRDTVDGRDMNADTTISTVHQAKGHEWDYVTLYSDFPNINAMMDAPAKRPDERQLRLMDNFKIKRAWDCNPNLERVHDIEQLRILYVAVTRSSGILDFHDTDNIPVPTQETIDLMRKMEEEGKLKLV